MHPRVSSSLPVCVPFHEPLDPFEHDEHAGRRRPLQLRHEREGFGAPKPIAGEEPPGVRARRQGERTRGP